MEEWERGGSTTGEYGTGWVWEVNKERGCEAGWEQGEIEKNFATS